MEHIAPKMLAAPPPKHSSEAMPSAPAVLDAPVPDAAVIPNLANRKGFFALGVSWICDDYAPTLGSR